MLIFCLFLNYGTAVVRRPLLLAFIFYKWITFFILFLGPLLHLFVLSLNSPIIFTLLWLPCDVFIFLYFFESFHIDLLLTEVIVLIIFTALIDSFIFESSYPSSLLGNC